MPPASVLRLPKILLNVRAGSPGGELLEQPRTVGSGIPVASARSISRAGCKALT
jgi:hypothetical protein